MHGHRVCRADQLPDVVVPFDPRTAGPIGRWRIGELRRPAAASKAARISLPSRRGEHEADVTARQAALDDGADLVKIGVV